MRNENNRIVELSLEFAIQTSKLCKILQNQKEYNIANQLFRSGTSIGANIRESQNSESKADFIHKLKIAAKEAEETDYWLIICQKLDLISSNSQIYDMLIQIKKLLNAIISTCYKNK
ncbi:MAG: hypothetical protein H6Q25_979 [Bacteroidetes bacterium]|nr:hypothetical protein [Bacteroidota bacterium]